MRFWFLCFALRSDRQRTGSYCPVSGGGPTEYFLMLSTAGRPRATNTGGWEMKSVSLCFVNGLCRHSGALGSAPKIGRWATCAAAAAVAAAALSWSPPTPAAELEPDEIFLTAVEPVPG